MIHPVDSAIQRLNNQDQNLGLSRIKDKKIRVKKNTYYLIKLAIVLASELCGVAVTTGRLVIESAGFDSGLFLYFSFVCFYFLLFFFFYNNINRLEKGRSNRFTKYFYFFSTVTI